MEIVTEPVNTPGFLKGAVAALGNFDGLHLGHQVVLGAARDLARHNKKPFGVMTFEPHPRSVFFPDHSPFRITPPSFKQRLLAQMGVDVLFEIPFSLEFSRFTAQHFAESLLVQQCGISHAVAGHDFVYGHGREGNIVTLRDTLSRHGVGLTEIPAQAGGDKQLWSSTRARVALQTGRMKDAAIILGRPWEIVGIVQRGDGRGKPMGFPTANLELNGYIRPRFGVYAVTALIGQHKVKGIANIGTRPTVQGAAERLEVHIFDYSEDLYGRDISVAFIGFIRDEEHFPSLDALKEQILKDCIEAKAILA